MYADQEQNEDGGTKLELWKFFDEDGEAAGN